VLSFWFGEPAQDEAALLAKFRRWFRGGPELDAEIARRFGAVHERAAARELDAWAQAPRGRLALIVVLDQFSRNIHRDTSRAYACDAAACRLAIEGLLRKLDAGMSPEERLFLALPLAHAEDPKMQDANVAYVQRIAAEAPAPLANAWQIAVASAREHQATIAKFGRFPQRNLAIGRTTTGLELTFLADMEQRKSRGSK